CSVPSVSARAFTQGEPADQLDGEMAHADGAPRRLADDGEGFRQHGVEVADSRVFLFELGGLCAQRLVAQRRYLSLKRVGLGDVLTVVSEQPLVPAAEYARQEIREKVRQKKGSKGEPKAAIVVAAGAGRHRA